MRECKQTKCVFLKLKTGCHKCSDCGVLPFIVSGDCLRCYNCENISGACRWSEEEIEDELKQEEKEKEKKERKKEKEEKKKRRKEEETVEIINEV